MSRADESPKFSICIPAYNRARHLAALLDSVYAQDYTDFQVLICEDDSREREQIAGIARQYAGRYPNTLRLLENESTLGYDANVRRLVQEARGEFCFFMGNDDLLCAEALSTVAGILQRHTDVGVVLKSYAWFDEVSTAINQEVRYFSDERWLAPGQEAISVCFRRSGVISGYIVHRESAQAAASSKFDGTLSYQLYLTASVLATRCAVATPKVLVLCRNNEPPEFGSSNNEKGMFTPGYYTPEARLRMVAGALSIITDLRDTTGIDVVEDVVRDYANYFYPYVKDQLNLPVTEFARMYREYGRMGFGKHPMFHVNCLVAYLIGERRFDAFTRAVRQKLGRSPQLGLAR